MVLGTDRAWRVHYPKLHALNLRTEKAVASAAARAAFFPQIEKCIATGLERGNQRLMHEWEAKRRLYFESTVFERGKAHLRDQSKQTVAQLQWANYFRPLRGDSETDQVPACVKSGSCHELRVVNIYKGRGKNRRHIGCDRRRVEYRCLEAGGDVINIGAWAPPELVKYDRRELCHIPIPPEDINREYQLHEICFALAVLHDADGSLDPLVPKDHSLRRDPNDAFGLWLMWIREPGMHVSASDEWADDLEPRVGQMETWLRESSSRSSSKLAGKKKKGRPREWWKLYELLDEKGEPEDRQALLIYYNRHHANRQDGRGGTHPKPKDLGDLGDRIRDWRKLRGRLGS